MIEDFILCKSGAVPHEMCHYLKLFFEQNPDWHKKGGIGGNKFIIDESKKKCTEILISKDHDIFRLIGPYLESACNEYIEKYPALNSCLSSWGQWKRFKIQKYNPNEGYFAEHIEYSEDEWSLRRVMAWMIYLNDVTDGGYTEFSAQKKRFQPKTGDILIWPAGWTHPHRGIVSETQTKYIATGWYTLN
jgi:hypothetical protein